MKRVVPKKNLLKNLIFIQENKTITGQTVEGMFRAFVEPLLNSPQEGLVVHRLLDKEPYNGLLNRLKYIDVKFVLDERIVDGYYYAAFFKHYRSILRHPEILDEPPAEVVPDID